jgi:hypothetical protein
VSFAVGNIYIIYASWIKPRPHDKISLCVCDTREWFFWINSDAAFHSIGQVPLEACCHRAISHESFLDLSGVKKFTPIELAGARDRGPVSAELLALIRTSLSTPISLLPETQRAYVLSALSVLP